MNWTEYNLGELIKVKHGFAFKSEFFSFEGKHIVLTPGNFYEAGGFKSRGDKDRFYSGEYPEQYLLKKNDLIIAMTEQGEGLLGSSSLIPEDDKFLHNQRLGLIEIIEPEKVDKYFLYLAFNNPIIRNQIAGSATGTKVKHTAPERIYRCKFKFPTKELQKKVTAIISSYDDLIENNLKRIKLLEEMAQITYEEWFVRMKFPGHETAVFDEETGLPEGWKRGRFAELFELQRGFDLPVQDRIEGANPIIASTGQIGTHSTAKVTGPGVITGRSGTIGEVAFCHDDFWPLNTSLWLKKQNYGGPAYAYLFLKNFNLERLSGGSAVPSLDRKVVHSQFVKIPHKELCNEFESQLIPKFDLMNNLRKQNDLLKEARDILLPRLMTGMIDIEQVELPEAMLNRLEQQEDKMATAV